MDIEKVARKYAVKNAVEHGGECDPGSVIGKIFAEEEFDNKGKVTQTAQTVCQEVNSMEPDEQRSELQEYEFDIPEKKDHDPVPDLDVEENEEVVVRFAPNPNGPPHIGHARGMTINGELRDKYDGKLILRFDDTDPVTKRPMEDAYEMYEEDYTWLGYEPDEVRYSSKNFDTYIEYAEKLIEMGKAYVCKCSQEEGQKYRKEGEPCPHRNQTSERNMNLWNGMRDGSVDQGDATLKIKTDMDHKNPAVRDFVAFRIIEDPEHPVTGNNYRVWPLLDFQGAIEDHIMGTTHIVRGKDLRASTKRQKFIYRYLGWEYPDIMYWGNVQISGFDAPVSGSTIKKMIQDEELEGWDDPRAPTIRALKKRGFQPEALQEFFIDMGVTENDVEASVESLEKENTRVIDEDADRYFFVADPVKLEVSGVPEDLEADMQVHPEHPERGTRNPRLEVEDGELQVYIDEEDMEDGFYRLKGVCNIKISDGSAEYVPGDHKDALERDAEFIHWTPAYSDTATVRMPDGKNLEGPIEPNQIENGEVVQFERFGFVRCDSKENSLFYYAHQ
ncbi:MAG: glutamyl-tRNA synthetase family protein [Candidatus Nanosalina sp. J07AB43]|nr:MAG: glutamyl-tRNA synthetase family protein [Candidatus Nanosalina sp. J07AB43]